MWASWWVSCVYGCCVSTSMEADTVRECLCCRIGGWEGFRVEIYAMSGEICYGCLAWALVATRLLPYHIKEDIASTNLISGRHNITH